MLCNHTPPDSCRDWLRGMCFRPRCEYLHPPFDVEQLHAARRPSSDSCIVQLTPSSPTYPPTVKPRVLGSVKGAPPPTSTPSITPRMSASGRAQAPAWSGPQAGSMAGLANELGMSRAEVEQQRLALEALQLQHQQRQQSEGTGPGAGSTALQPPGGLEQLSPRPEPSSSGGWDSERGEQSLRAGLQAGSGQPGAAPRAWESGVNAAAWEQPSLAAPVSSLSASSLSASRFGVVGGDAGQPFVAAHALGPAEASRILNHFGDWHCGVCGQQSKGLDDCGCGQAGPCRQAPSRRSTILIARHTRVLVLTNPSARARRRWAVGECTVGNACPAPHPPFDYGGAWTMPPGRRRLSKPMQRAKLWPGAPAHQPPAPPVTSKDVAGEGLSPAPASQGWDPLGGATLFHTGGGGHGHHAGRRSTSAAWRRARTSAARAASRGAVPTASSGQRGG